ncbi:ABC transporter permease/substrate-binding protein [Bacillus sp. B-jedd]|uniref:ABC transporter permease/substrate-binding protein n=1 Tax=Bacillus sp. B-jedd TaxID=1476857 RepID=UPI0005156B99|nr:glycine betaine ABC transporter substrate-binding protein [Bacillus sp. B-jedd]CEG26511.1 proline/glycine betaine ABC transporter permease [Bacillus sp. B-jedd]
MNDFVNYVTNNTGQIINLLGQHIYLSVVSVLIAIAVGVPLGIAISRSQNFSKPVIGTANVVQAVPSLALLGFLIPFIGIGSTPAIVMVVLYSLLPIVKNTYTGLTNIDRDILEAARGIGLTNSQIMRKIQLPLAFPIIMAGVRISAVTAVGLMTIAAFVGAGGLGYLVFSGVSTVDNNMILAGAIPACILALLIDFAVGRLESRLSYTTKMAASSKRSKPSFAKKAALPALIGILVIGIGVSYAFNMVGAKEKISIGSKNFTESVILANMAADLIEAKTDIQVERKLNLGGTQVVFSALKKGDVDTYIEYTGTGLVTILKKEVSNNPDEVFQTVHDEFEKQFGIKTLKPLGFNNTYTLAVRQDTADKYGLETFSDLAAVSNELTVGATIEFTNRVDGLPGLSKTYNMDFGDLRAVDGGLRYTAIKSKESDVIDAFSTDGLLEEFKLKVLEDDKQFFPPYYAVPLVREDTLKAHPELKETLEMLAGKLTDEKMRELNYRVDSLKQSPKKVAKDFLIEEGLVE